MASVYINKHLINKHLINKNFINKNFQHQFLLRIMLVFVAMLPIHLQAKQVQPQITILSTMVANFSGEGEWGFAALIETPQKKVLFDTGFKAETVLHNAQALGIDLSQVEIVVLTHFHSDHTGGLLTLREHYQAINPKALTTVYVARGFFSQRYTQSGTPAYSLPNQDFTQNFSTPAAFRKAAESLGIQFHVIDKATEIIPGMTLTGPIPRIHPEKNVGGGFYLKDATGRLVADTVPESQVLGVQTTQGWLMVSGCGHAGIVNASEQLKELVDQPIHMAVGGFHLFRADDQTINWTAQKLGAFGYQSLVGAHCTGAYATHRMAELLSWPRQAVSIGAVGTRINPDLSIVRASID